MEDAIRYLLDRGEDGDDEEAIRLCDQALALAPGDATMLVLKSEALRNLDMYEEAVGFARQATLARNGAGFTHKALGLALLDLAEDLDDAALLVEAEGALRAAAERDAEDPEIRYWLAEVSYRQGRTAAAVEELGRLGVDSGWTAVTVARLVRLISEGARPRPPQQREASLRHPDACRSIGIALRSVGALDEALEEFREAARVDPLSPELDYQVAVVSYIRGGSEDALALLELALSFPTFAEAAELAAACASRMGRRVEAIEYLRDATRRAELAGAPERYVMRLDRQLRAMQDGDAARIEPVALSVPSEEEIPCSGSRERSVTLGFRSLDEYRGAMARLAVARFAQSAEPEFTARYIARTAQHYAPPELSERAWSRAMAQAGDVWDSMDGGERYQFAGLFVLGEWLSGPDGTSPVDAAALPAAALGLARAAAEVREVNEGLRERLSAIAAGIEGSPRPLGLSQAWDLVAELLGRPGQAGPMQAILASPRAGGGA